MIELVFLKEELPEISLVSQKKNQVRTQLKEAINKPGREVSPETNPIAILILDPKTLEI